MLRTNSIVEILRGITELLLCPLRVSRRRVQVFVAEDLGQRYKVILIIGEELMGHRVAQQMRMNLESANGAVFVA